MAFGSSSFTPFIILGLLLVCLGEVKPVRSAISCNQVVTALTPCVNVVLYGGAVTSQCCQGVQNVYAAARTTPDRRQICTCIKNVAGGAGSNSAIIKNAAALPGKCGLNIPYKISPSTDCNSIK